MDLSTLSDDRFLELIKIVDKEISRRAIYTHFSANKYQQETKEEIFNNIPQPISTNFHSNNTLNSTEVIQATLVNLLKNLDFSQNHKNHNFSLSILEKKGDICLYLQQSFQPNGWKMVYFHTGNKDRSSGTISCPDLKVYHSSGFKQFAKMLCKELSAGFKCYSNDDDRYLINPTLKQRYWNKL